MARVSALELRQLEQKYGGSHKGIPRIVVSPLDARSSKQIERGGMAGGDRMIGHGYADVYADYLSLDGPVVLVELGVLLGAGLALWCDLLPAGSRVIGLDVDTEYFEISRTALKAMGAFARIEPEVHTFDELSPDAPALLESIVGDDRISIMIDDALHYDAAIIQTHGYVRPLMATESLYFIEDNNTVSDALYGKAYGRLTVIRC